MSVCVCGSDKSGEDCCLPYLRGDEKPPTAEALMRSRYAAFTEANAEYLMATQECRDPVAAREQMERSFVGAKWLGLRVLETKQGGSGDKRGWITFVATYLASGRTHELRERSLFRKVRGAWRYIPSAD